MTISHAFRPSKRWLTVLGALLLAAPCAHAAGDEDALGLQSAPVEEKPAAAQALRLYAEFAFGHADRRVAPTSQTQYRSSLDLRWSDKLAPGWKAALSDRADALDPNEPGKDHLLNSLREAYVSWSDASATWAADLGRVNLRSGPGYGYNPTDFFRDGSLRAFTTANPIALRENRMGSVIVRGQRLWQGGSFSAAYSPKLADAPSPSALSLDLGSTNSRQRGLLVLGLQPSERLSANFSLYKDGSLDVQPGVSGTALLTDAVVAYAEWSAAREPSLADRAWGVAGHVQSGQRFAGGLTYTTASKLSLTAEYQANGFALSQGDWNAVTAANPLQAGAYLQEAQRRQDLPTRTGWLFYASQHDLALKNLDLTAFVQYNPGDRSRVAWGELRYHWPQLDLALQMQANSGRAGSIYGSVPERRNLQAVLAYYFP